MQYEMSRKKLRHYFGNVTYIDDKFDFCLVNEDYYDADDEDDDGGPPLPIEADPQPLEPQKERDLSDEEKSGINLIALVKKLNEDKYSDIRLHPVAYSQDSKPETLYPQIISSPLTLIDWDLGDGKKAFPIIKQVFEQTHQLKVIVVYTASFYDAVSNFSSDPELECFPCIKKADMLQAHQCNNRSLLIIAGKQKYNILSLLDFITNLFIDTCGIMPIALIDFIESAREMSDRLFGAFSEPFADLYFLQTHYSQMNENDATEAMTIFLQNKFRDICTVDSSILQELYQLQKSRLETYAKSGTAEGELVQNIDLLIPHLEDFEKAFCLAMKQVPFSVFKRCCEDAVDKSSCWADVVDYFTSYYQEAQKRYVNSKIDTILRPYAGLDLSANPELEAEAKANRQELEDSITRDISEAVGKFQKQITPILLQLLISSSNILSNSIEMVKTLKYKCYDNPSLRDLLYSGRKYKDQQKADFLLNKLHFGDVLIRHKKTGTEYLLCITPPCDMFRPDKIKYNIVYLRGVEVKHENVNAKRKENGHLSILPVYDKDLGREEIKYINWRYFDIVRFNLKTLAEYDELCEWQRPYTMAEPYARQIANAFTAYFSRAGVDELFMKSENNLRRLFK